MRCRFQCALEGAFGRSTGLLRGPLWQRRRKLANSSLRLLKQGKLHFAAFARAPYPHKDPTLRLPKPPSSPTAPRCRCNRRASRVILVWLHIDLFQPCRWSQNAAGDRVTVLVRRIDATALMVSPPVLHSRRGWIMNQVASIHLPLPEPLTPSWMKGRFHGQNR
jgi:hypothetical protein